MTHRKLPSIKAFDAPKGGVFEAPANAFTHWQPVKAASTDENTINVYDQIGENWDGTGLTARLVNSVLRKSQGEKVTVNVNSPGGDFFEGVTIYNMLREYEGEVEVRVIGLAASAASVIAMAADELKIAKAGFLMIHNSWGMVIGNQNDMREASEMFATFDSAMANLYSNRSGIDVKTIAEYMNGEFWMTGEEAVENGFADSFIKSDEITEDEEKVNSVKHRIDIALARQGVPRSERRAMFKEFTGTQNAADNATQNAGELDSLMEAVTNLQVAMKG